MGKVVLEATVSIDGFIADLDDQVGPLFDWYAIGTAKADYGDDQRVFSTSAASAQYVEQGAADTGACVIGRRLFDLTNGWGGRPAAGDAVFVVTHRPPDDWPFPDAPFSFVTDGVASAIRQAQNVAGDRDVSVMAGDVGNQALRDGLIDEIRLDLVPVVLGGGRRFFGGDGSPTLMLDDPRIIEGDRVTHLVYNARRDLRPASTSNAEIEAALREAGSGTAR